MNNIECELKMSLTKTEYKRMLSVGNVEPQLQVNHYFYCKGMPKDIMLRIRSKGGKYLFCYKRLISAENGVNVCDEREQPLDESRAQELLRNGITPTELLELVNVDLPYGFRCIGALSTYRAKFNLQGWTIELDENEYLGKTDYELECECESFEALQELKNFLYDNYGVRFRRSISKSARFFNRYKRKKHYKHIIFDFDGTINDTSEGIYATFTAVLKHFGIDATGKDLSEHIGPPLKYSYTKLLDAERCDEAIELHRKVFVDINAVAMSKPYDGAVELLQRVTSSGKYTLSVASCKYEPHLIASLKMLGIDKYFDHVYAQTATRQFKADVLKALIEENGFNRRECLLIGDTLNDVDGAVANGIDVVAVTYGFGKREELELSPVVALCDSPEQVADFLLKE